MLKEKKYDHVCPWWVGYILASPVRKLWQDPVKMLSPYISRGMTLIDAGSAMGFFTLPMAEMTGPGGRVIAIDLQERMLQTLRKRAARKGLLSIIEPRVCSTSSLTIDDCADMADFAIAIALVHEVSDREKLFTELCTALKQGGRLFFSEPSDHVSLNDFEESVEIACASGFTVEKSPSVRRSHSVVLKK